MERYLIIGLIINASIAVGGFLPACFQEHECYVSIISLDKVEKGPVKLAFICTYVYYGGNRFSMLLYAFSQHYYL